MLAREWVLKRNCSLSPRQLALVFLVMSATSLSVALFFAVQGVWFVLGFSVLEVLALGWAFFYYARRVLDRERIALADGWLVVEVREAGQTREIRLNARSAQLFEPVNRRRLIGLEADGVRMEIGQFLTESRRCEFARELSAALDLQR